MFLSEHWALYRDFQRLKEGWWDILHGHVPDPMSCYNQSMDDRIWTNLNLMFANKCLLSILKAYVK